PELLPPHPEQIVIEVLESVAAESDVLAAIRKIRALGYQIALDDFVLTPDNQALIDLADIVKIDVLQPADSNAIALFKSKNLALLAEKVESYEQFKQLSTQGFTLFQGFFYGRPETHHATARNRSNNRAALVRLLTQLHREDINLRELESLIMQDPEL